MLRNPTEMCIEAAAAFEQLAEFVELGLAAQSSDGSIHFVPLCHDDTEY